MIKFLIIYLIIGIFHGIWGLTRQKKYHPKFTSFWKMVLVFIINCLFFPITLSIAIIKKRFI